MEKTFDVWVELLAMEREGGKGDIVDYEVKAENLRNFMYFGVAGMAK